MIFRSYLHDGVEHKGRPARFTVKGFFLTGT
jgi:hypothetical protein